MVSSVDTMWRRRADLPLPRAGCAVGVVDGRVVVAGGTSWIDDAKRWTDRVDLYDPVDDCWTEGPPLPVPCGDAAAAVLDGCLVVLGGGASGTAVDSALRFDGREWSEVPQLTLPSPRRSAVAVAHDGAVFMFGGLPPNGGYESAATSVWRAGPDGPWQPCRPVPGPARVSAAAASVGGRIMIAGGCTAVGDGVQNLDSVLAYDPVTDSWTTLATMPVAVRAACGVEADGRMLVIGGYTDRFATTTLTIDTAGRIDGAPELPVGLADARFVRTGGTVIGVSGEDGVKQRFAGTLAAEIGRARARCDRQ